MRVFFLRGDVADAVPVWPAPAPAPAVPLLMRRGLVARPAVGRGPASPPLLRRAAKRAAVWAKRGLLLPLLPGVDLRGFWRGVVDRFLGELAPFLSRLERARGFAVGRDDAGDGMESRPDTVTGTDNRDGLAPRDFARVVVPALARRR